MQPAISEIIMTITLKLKCGIQTNGISINYNQFEYYLWE